MWLVLWLAFPVWLEDVGSEPHTSNVGKILEAFQPSKCFGGADLTCGQDKP